MNREALGELVRGCMSDFRTSREHRSSISRRTKSLRTYGNYHFLEVRNTTVGDLQEEGHIASGRVFVPSDAAFGRDLVGDIIEFANENDAHLRKIIFLAYPGNTFGIFVSRLKENPDDGTTSQSFEPLYETVQKRSQQVLGMDGDLTLAALRLEPFAEQVKLATVFAQ